MYSNNSEFKNGLHFGGGSTEIMAMNVARINFQSKLDESIHF
jgi:hypothetical protein